MVKKTQISKLYSFLFLAFCFFIPFEEYAKAIPNILIGVIAILFPFVFNKEEFIKKIRSRSYLTLVVLFVFVLAMSLFTSKVQEDMFFLSKIAIPCIIIFLASPLKNGTTIQKAFIVSTVIAVLISLFNILQYTNLNNHFKFTVGSIVNELLVSERLYIGFCSVISIVFSLNLYFDTNKKSVKIISLIVGVLLISFVFIISARIAIISTLFVLILLFVKKFSFKAKLIGSASLIFLVTFSFLMNRNLLNRFFYLDDNNLESLFEKIAVWEPRVVIWDCSLKIINTNHNFVFGNGYKTVKNQLVECYKEEIDNEGKKNWFLEQKYNTHNQFLDFFISSGIVGFFLFFLSLFYLYKDSSKSFLALALIGALLLILLIENILHRQIGGYLFALIFIVVTMKKQNSLRQKDSILYKQ